MNEPTVEQMTKLYGALSKAQGQVKPATKDRKGQIGTQTYKYADLEAVAGAVGTALVDNGLAILFSPGLFSAPTIELKATIVHADGGWMEFPMSFPVDLTYPKTGSPYYSAQNVGKVLTYARRYAKVGILDIVTEDEDGAQVQGSGNRQPPTADREWSNEPPASGHLAQAALELGAKPVARPSQFQEQLNELIEEMKATDTPYPSKGIIGMYLNNSNTLSAIDAEQLIAWSTDNPGVPPIELLRIAAQYAFSNLPAGQMKNSAQQWLGANS